MAETTSTTWWQSKLALRLEIISGVAAMAVVCRVAIEEDASWMPWLLAGAAVVVVSLARWPYGALLVLVAASAMPRFSVGLFGWNARPEHFAVAILTILTALWLLMNGLRTRLDKLDYWVLAYIAANYLSSMFTSSEPSATLRWALQNNLAVLSYFLIRFLVNDLETLRNAFRILLGIGIAETSYGLLCYASHYLFGTNEGMEVGQYLVDVAAPFGTMYEPNLFGAYAGCVAILFLALYLSQGLSRSGYLLGFAVASLATVSSYSRAALLALILASAWVLWKTRHFRSRNSTNLIAFATGLGLILAIAVMLAGNVLRERLSDLYYQGFTEGTMLPRVLVIQQAIQDVPNHPILGSGTASFNLSFDWAAYIPEWESDKTWIGNAPLRILHDTGIVGLTTMLGFLISVWLKIRRGLRELNSPMLLALAAGAVLYGISFQSTDGTILAFFWVYLGFLASAAILTTNSDQRGL